MKSISMSIKDNELIVSDDGSLSFRHGGGEWRSAGPLLVVHYYDRQHPRAQQYAVPQSSAYAMGTAGTPSLSGQSELRLAPLGDRGARLFVRSKSAAMTLQVDIVLAPDGSGFDVVMPPDFAREDNDRLYRLLGIEVLPEFGAARSGEEGYLTLPNWFGAQCFFDKTYPREARQTVYSPNDQWEYVCNMPVFGITREQGTLCGLIAEGDYDAELIHRVHWEERQSNSTHPYLVYRWEQQDEAMEKPRRVRYRFAPADYEGGEGYVFVGKEYRRFLREDRGMMLWPEKAEIRPEAVDYRDRFFLKIFMAYKDPQADGHGDYHATCTFDEAREILEQCLARGMRKLSVCLVGWGQDGHDGMPPTRLPADERLGGEKAMRALIAWCKEQDIQLGVHDSYGGSYSCSPEHNTEDLIRHRSGEYWESIIWSGGQIFKVCPAVWLDKHTRRDMPAIAKLGVHGHLHIDAVGAFMPCYSEDHPLPDREENCRYVARMFELANHHFGSVSTEMPFGQWFPVVDGFYHSYVHPNRWHLETPIGRHFYDRTVPLLAVAVHGSIKCNQHLPAAPAGRLEMIDMGLRPQFEVACRPAKPFGIPTYEEQADTVAEGYRVFFGDKSDLAVLSDQTIEGRWEIADGVTETLYADGTRLRVNRSSDPHDGVAPGEFRLETVTADGLAEVAR